ncbi:MAG: UDP-N-acetylmuramate--L-alanine ligase [Patescibacteria group bacterium]|nr:UDP-N-acetylmuramate--L-alanine ligase [Patescibacteria group bacterium]
MNLQKVEKIHFIGLGGIGVSALAKMMVQQGKKVFGSDLNSSEIIKKLEKMGVKFYQGHKAENLSVDTDLVIYSPAVEKNNPERIKAKKLSIPQLSYPEFLGELSKEKFTIAVSGTHGKSTTTAILGLILEQAELDPLVIVGSKVPQWNGNLRMTQTDTDGTRTGTECQCRSVSGPCKSVFVVESCEWRAHMLNLSPKMIILNNLELDHTDYYKDINHLIRTFKTYIKKLPKDGIIILNSDDSNLKKLHSKSKTITFGVKNQAEVMAKNIITKSGEQIFDLCLHGKIYNFRLKVPGIFNVYNVLAATAGALALGVKPEIIKKSVENFYGIWRRFEKVGEYKKAIIISDYAHHPTAVSGTIQAAKEFYPEKRIMAVFQPHHHNRTKKLFKEFIKCFKGADLTIISEIYDVAGREEEKDQDVSSKDLVKAIRARYKKIPNSKFQIPNSKNVLYAKNLVEVKKLILKNIKPGDIVLIMGAGDIFEVANDLV